tara:strand:+ start:470 stop:748 length:279 start_codon:yes stop_codon:yes gene_type:complete
MSKLETDLLINYSGQILTMTGAGDRPKVRGQMDEVGLIDDGIVAVREGRIVYGDKREYLEDIVSLAKDVRVIDAEVKSGYGMNLEDERNNLL